jgi:HEAT repeat protein
VSDDGATAGTSASQARQTVVIAGHTGDVAAARAGLAHPDPSVRASALGALERLGALTHRDIVAHLTEDLETSPDVRRRAAEAGAAMTDLALLPALSDHDWSVVEMAAWSIGEHETADDATLQRLIVLATSHEESLVREAAVAALGAVGDPRGLPAIIAATTDRAPVRRRAAVALAPFDEPEAEAALRTLLSDRDWQTRQIAEDLLDERPDATDS